MLSLSHPEGGNVTRHYYEAQCSTRTPRFDSTPVNLAPPQQCVAESVSHLFLKVSITEQGASLDIECTVSVAGAEIFQKLLAQNN